jgi:hypothetical protein
MEKIPEYVNHLQLSPYESLFSVLPLLLILQSKFLYFPSIRQMLF